MPPGRGAARPETLRASAWAAAALVASGVLACSVPPPAVSRPESARPPAGHVRVAGIVLKWVKGDKRANLERLVPLIREAARNGAQIVCTTEGALDGYVITELGRTSDILAYAETVPDGAALRELRQVADEEDVHLVIGLLEGEGATTFNAAVVLGPDGEHLGTYHKRNIGFEAKLNTPGDAPVLIDSAVGRFGLIICADRREPELVAPYRELGADFVLCPSGGMFGRRNDKIVSQRSRETGLPIVFVHPVEFLVTGPGGSVTVRALLGDELFVEPSEIGTRRDSSAVFYHDVAVGP